MLSTQHAITDDIQSLLGQKKVSGASRMLYLVDQRECREIPLHYYEKDSVEEMFDDFVSDVRTVRMAIHAQAPRTRIVSLCVYFNILLKTCDNWFCSEVAAFLGMPVEAKPFMLYIEDKMPRVGKLTKDTLRLFLRSMKLLVDLERHILVVPEDTWMMPGGIQALNIKNFEHVALNDYMMLARKTGRNPVRKSLKRVFSEL